MHSLTRRLLGDHNAQSLQPDDVVALRVGDVDRQLAAWSRLVGAGHTCTVMRLTAEQAELRERLRVAELTNRHLVDQLEAARAHRQRIVLRESAIDQRVWLCTAALILALVLLTSAIGLAIATWQSTTPPPTGHATTIPLTE